MWFFLLYAAVCFWAMTLNTRFDNRMVCLVCGVALLAGVAIDPLIAVLPTLIAYLLVCALNLITLLYIPYTVPYRLIPILVYGGIILCFHGAVCAYLGLSDIVPYVSVTHGLNVLQIGILVVNSDRFMGSCRRRTDVNRDKPESDLRDRQSYRGFN